MMTFRSHAIETQLSKLDAAVAGLERGQDKTRRQAPDWNPFFANHPVLSEQDRVDGSRWALKWR